MQQECQVLGEHPPSSVPGFRRPSLAGLTVGAFLEERLDRCGRLPGPM
jgi:hypothetical protein